MKIIKRHLLLLLIPFAILSCDVSKKTASTVEQPNIPSVTSEVPPVPAKATVKVVPPVKVNKTDKPSTTTAKVPSVITEVPPTPAKPNVEIETPVKVNKADKPSATSASTAELEMIAEINKVRTNPKAYLPYIAEYLEYYKKRYPPFYENEKKTAASLIAELKTMTPVQKLTYHEKLFKVAESHGKDLRQRNDIYEGRNPHEGSVIKTPGERIEKGTGLQLNGENFGTNHENPRFQLICLLIDSDYPGAGHRKNILDPRWNVAASYDIGSIGEAPGCWVQLFAQSNEAVDGGNVSSGISMVEVNRLLAQASYMTAEEKEMFKEINMLRADPKGYIKHVETYKTEVKSGEVMITGTNAEEFASADDLIKELRKMAPLPLLQPDQSLFKIAATHGQFLTKKGSPEMNFRPHTGANNKNARQRILEGTKMSDGGENYAAGFLSIRQNVIMLLVDAGIPSLGHRKALLNRNWNYLVCHNFGPIKSSTSNTLIPYFWIQNFATK